MPAMANTTMMSGTTGARGRLIDVDGGSRTALPVNAMAAGRPVGIDGDKNGRSRPLPIEKHSAGSSNGAHSNGINRDGQGLPSAPAVDSSLSRHLANNVTDAPVDSSETGSVPKGCNDMREERPGTIPPVEGGPPSAPPADGSLRRFLANDVTDVMALPATTPVDSSEAGRAPTGCDDVRGEHPAGTIPPVDRGQPTVRPVVDSSNCRPVDGVINAMAPPMTTPFRVWVPACLSDGDGNRKRRRQGSVTPGASSSDGKPSTAARGGAWRQLADLEGEITMSLREAKERVIPNSKVVHGGIPSTLSEGESAKTVSSWGGAEECAPNVKLQADGQGAGEDVKTQTMGAKGGKALFASTEEMPLEKMTKGFGEKPEGQEGTDEASVVATGHKLGGESDPKERDNINLLDIFKQEKEKTVMAKGSVEEGGTIPTGNLIKARGQAREDAKILITPAGRGAAAAAPMTAKDKLNAEHKTKGEIHQVGNIVEAECILSGEKLKDEEDLEMMSGGFLHQERGRHTGNAQPGTRRPSYAEAVVRGTKVPQPDKTKGGAGSRPSCCPSGARISRVAKSGHA